MGTVGGSRHYTGGGLGDERGWKCPSCGAENLGLISQGCQLCGAGKPGRKLEDDGMRQTAEHVANHPPFTQAEPPRQENARQGDVGQGDVATWWAQQHPDVSIEDAYRTGYYDGVQAARRAELARRRPAEPTLAPEGKIARTIVAALEYFADQVLRAAPHEVETGEWCSVEEVRTLISQLTTTGEVVHG